MLDVRRLQVLRAVVTSGTVTAAAAHLGYTPSAVSQQVAALEKQAGTALLERVGRGVRPTAAGLLLTEHAALISAAVARAETALADLRAGRTGSLSVRYFATAGSTLVAPALARFRAAHPGVRVDLELADPGDPSWEAVQDRADLAVVVQARDRVGDGFRLVGLLKDPYAAVLPLGHPLAGEEVIDLNELSGEQWVGSEPPGPCLEPVTDACAAAGFSPDVVIQSEDYATAQGFVAAGLGVGLMPRLGLRSRHPGVVVRPVRNPEPVRLIAAAVRETALQQPAARGLLEALREAAAGDLPGGPGRPEPGPDVPGLRTGGRPGRGPHATAARAGEDGEYGRRGHRAGGGFPGRAAGCRPARAGAVRRAAPAGGAAHAAAAPDGVCRGHRGGGCPPGRPCAAETAASRDRGGQIPAVTPVAASRQVGGLAGGCVREMHGPLGQDGGSVPSLRGPMVRNEAVDPVNLPGGAGASVAALGSGARRP